MANRLILKSSNPDFDIAFFACSPELIDVLKSDITDIYIHSKSDNMFAKMALEFEKKHGLKPKDILSYGDTSVTSGFIEPLLDKITIGQWFANRYNDPTRLRNSYKCFRSNRWDFSQGFMTHIIHEDPMHSWGCAMEMCRYPKYGIISKVKKGTNIDKIKLHDVTTICV